MHHYLGVDARKPVLGGGVNNTGADQPAHPRRVVSALVIRLLESILYILATSEIPIFSASLCSWGYWFESHFVGNPEDRFSRGEAHLIMLYLLPKTSKAIFVGWG